MGFLSNLFAKSPDSALLSAAKSGHFTTIIMIITVIVTIVIVMMIIIIIIAVIIFVLSSTVSTLLSLHLSPVLLLTISTSTVFMLIRSIRESYH